MEQAPRREERVGWIETGRDGGRSERAKEGWRERKRKGKRKGKRMRMRKISGPSVDPAHGVSRVLCPRVCGGTFMKINFSHPGVKFLTYYGN